MSLLALISAEQLRQEAKSILTDEDFMRIVIRSKTDPGSEAPTSEFNKETCASSVDEALMRLVFCNCPG